MFRKTILFIIAMVTASYAQAATDSATVPRAADHRFPLELGGYFTYDLAAPASDWKKADVPLSLSWMELSARVPVATHLVGAITILSRNGPRDLQIWQCLASYDDSGTSLVVGQQNFHHGLLATRLVSNPLIWDSAWRNAPGAEISRTMGAWTLGAGAAVTTIPADSAAKTEDRNDPSASGYVDWVPDEGSVVRASGAAGKRWQDADLAANLALASFLVDVEGYGKFRDRDPDLLGFSLGLAWQSGAWTFGTRYDRLKPDGDNSWQGRASLGAVAQFWEAMFAGLEVSRTDHGNVGVDFQVGLSSHMKIPGFTPQQPGR
jgi:hypothetical protein